MAYGYGSGRWWEDRVIALHDLAGQEVTLHFSAAHVDRRGHPNLKIGFERVAVMALSQGR